MERISGMKRMGMARWFDGRARNVAISRELPGTAARRLQRMLREGDNTQGGGPSQGKHIPRR